MFLSIKIIEVLSLLKNTFKQQPYGAWVLLFFRQNKIQKSNFSLLVLFNNEWFVMTVHFCSTAE